MNVSNSTVIEVYTSVLLADNMSGTYLLQSKYLQGPGVITRSQCLITVWGSFKVPCKSICIRRNRNIEKPHNNFWYIKLAVKRPGYAGDAIQLPMTTYSVTSHHWHSINTDASPLARENRYFQFSDHGSHAVNCNKLWTVEVHPNIIPKEDLIILITFMVVLAFINARHTSYSNTSYIYDTCITCNTATQHTAIQTNEYLLAEWLRGTGSGMLDSRYISMKMSLRK